MRGATTRRSTTRTTRRARGARTRPSRSSRGTGGAGGGREGRPRVRHRGRRRGRGGVSFREPRGPGGPRPRGVLRGARGWYDAPFLLSAPLGAADLLARGLGEDTRLLRGRTVRAGRPSRPQRRGR